MSFACGSEEARQYKVFCITPRENFVFYVFLSQPAYELLRVGLEFVFAVFAAEVVRLPFVEVMVLSLMCSFVCRGVLVDFSPTHWVDCHRPTPSNWDRMAQSAIGEPLEARGR